MNKSLKAGRSNYNGVFAPNSRYRGRVTKARWGRGGRRGATGDAEAPTPVDRRASMSWAQRLKRVFGIDIETCPACGGAVRLFACLPDPVVIEKTGESFWPRASALHCESCRSARRLCPTELGRRTEPFPIHAAPQNEAATVNAGPGQLRTLDQRLPRDSFGA